MRTKTTGNNNNELTLHVNPAYHEQKKSSAHPPCAGNATDHFLELDYEKVRGLTVNEAPGGKIIVAELLECSAYKYLEYIEVSTFNNTMLLSLEVNFRCSEWKQRISLIRFVETLRKHMLDKHAIDSVQENLFDEDLIHSKFKLVCADTETVESAVNRFIALLTAGHMDSCADEVFAVSAIRDKEASQVQLIV